MICLINTEVHWSVVLWVTLWGMPWNFAVKDKFSANMEKMA